VAVSNTESRSSGGTGTGALSSLSSATGRTTTATFGANAVAGRHWFLEHRLNYTTNSYDAQPGFDPINGAQPLPLDLVIPDGANSAYVNVNLTTGVTGNFIEAGQSIGTSQQRQLNAVTSLTTVRSGHTLKLGTDIRYLSPVLDVPEVRVTYQLGAVAALTGSTIGRVSAVRATPPDGALWNMSLFAQDQWQVNDRLALTYGLRWDVNPAPEASGDRRPFLVEHPEDPARTVPVAAADEFWRTWYGGVAPRGAVVYRLSRGSGHEQIIRASAGLFHDVGWGGSTSALGRGFPFSSTRQLQNIALPLDANSVPPLPAPTDSPGTSTVYSFPDRPTLPRSVQWNVGYEYAQGSRFSAAATYLAARGDDLTRSVRYDYSGTAGAPFSVIDAIDHTGSSEYDALELRLRFRPLRAIDGELSYTLGESIDNVSDDVNTAIPSEREDPARSLGPSDFDVRHAINWRVGATTPRWNGAASAFSDVSLYVSALYRSAMPTTPVYFRNIGFGTYTFRPDVVSGVPLYLEDDAYPGGRRVNPAAFQQPVEARQGTAGRNSVRGFPLSQIDLSIKKRVPFARVRVEVGVDVFNVFNTAQFDRPSLSVGNARFGLATQTLASAFGTGTSGRGLSPLFQPGGARSVQLVARTTF
jgi:outer membrane receptor protein involved in Fe transport